MDVAYLGNLLHCIAERDDRLEGTKLDEDSASEGALINAHRYDSDVARPLRGK